MPMLQSSLPLLPLLPAFPFPLAACHPPTRPWGFLLSLACSALLKLVATHVEKMPFGWRGMVWWQRGGNRASTCLDGALINVKASPLLMSNLTIVEAMDNLKGHLPPPSCQLLATQGINRDGWEVGGWGEEMQRKEKGKNGRGERNQRSFPCKCTPALTGS